jgi:hypothetical protein
MSEPVATGMKKYKPRTWNELVQLKALQFLTKEKKH